MVFSAGFGGTGWAATPTVMQWSEIIARQQPERVMAEAWTAQQAQAEAAGGNLLGQTTLTLLHENDMPTDREGIRNWEVGISLPLKALRQQAAYSALAEGYADLSAAQQALLAWRARGIARQLLDGLIVRQIRLDHARARLDQAKRLYALVEQQVQAGERSRLDAVLARQQLAEAEAAVSQAEAAMKAQQARLAGWQITVNTDEVALLLEKPKPVLRQSDDLAVVIARHPEIRYLAARQKLALAEARKGLWDAQNSAEIGFGVRHEQARGVPDNTLVTLEVSVPLGRSPEAALARGQVRLTEVEARAELARAEQDLKLALIEALAEVAQRKARIAPAEAALAAAEEALTLSRQAWRQGEISLQALLLAQQAQLEARLQVALAQYEYDRAVRNLNQQAGE